MVGRPILKAASPKDMAEKITSEIADALAKKENVSGNLYTMPPKNKSPQKQLSQAVA